MIRRAQQPIEAWTEGTVDRSADHIGISYGESRRTIALVAPRRDKGFTVQFLLKPCPEDARVTRILNDVRGELAFYLLYGIGSESWLFAKYHCGSPANQRSSVRWNWHPRVSAANEAEASP